MRLTIIGHCGSGKSTLARRASEEFGLPHIHLDRFWFEAGGHLLKKGDEAGRERVRAHVREKVIAAMAQNAWVSDGQYFRVQPLIAERADQIIFLDIPLWRRLANHLHRVFRDDNRHPELSRLADLLFIFEIVKRTWRSDAKMRAFMREHEDKVIHIRSHQAADAYFARLKDSFPAPEK